VKQKKPAPRAAKKATPKRSAKVSNFSSKSSGRFNKFHLLALILVFAIIGAVYTFASHAATGDGSIGVYRLFQPGSQEHMFTTSSAEKDNLAKVQAGATRFDNNDNTIPAQERLYGLVKSYADDYYGKRFLVRLPDVSQKYVQEENRYEYDYNIADGGYLPEGATPLGLQEFNSDLFQLEDGRFTSFVRFNLQNIKLNFSYNFEFIGR
jgi:hypothetical protein